MLSGCIVFALVLVAAATASAKELPAPTPIEVVSNYNVEAISECTDPTSTYVHFPWVELGRVCVIPGQKTAGFMPSVRINVTVDAPGRYNVMLFDSDEDKSPMELQFGRTNPFSCEELVNRSFYYSEIPQGSFEVTVEIPSHYVRLWYVLLTRSCDGVTMENATCPSVSAWNVTWLLTDAPTSTLCTAYNVQQTLTEVMATVSDMLGRASIESLTTVYGLSTLSVVVLYLTSAVMCLLALILLFWALQAKSTKSVIFFTSFFICASCALSYLIMATGNGAWVLHKYVMQGSSVYAWGGMPMSAAVLQPTHDEIYIIFWVRFLEWTSSTLLMFRQLCLVAGGTRGSMEFLTASVLVLVGSIYTATMDVHGTRWIFVVVGLGWFGAIVLCIYSTLRISAMKREHCERRLFDRLVVTFLPLCVVYGWVWFLGEGLRLLGNNGSVVLYAILDIVTKGLWVLTILRANPTPHFAERNAEENSAGTRQLVAGVEYTEEEEF